MYFKIKLLIRQFKCLKSPKGGDMMFQPDTKTETEIFEISWKGSDRFRHLYNSLWSKKKTEIFIHILNNQQNLNLHIKQRSKKYNIPQIQPPKP